MRVGKPPIIQFLKPWCLVADMVLSSFVWYVSSRGERAGLYAGASASYFTDWMGLRYDSKSKCCAVTDSLIETECNNGMGQLGGVAGSTDCAVME